MNFSIARKNKSGAIAWSEDQVHYIIDEYTKKDRTLKSIAQDFLVLPQSIRNLLRKYDIKITNKKTSRFPRYSDYFHCIDSHEKSYWVGMMLSDGSITNGNSVNLGLKDKNHVEKFQKAIGAVHNKIITIQDDRFNKSCINYRLSVRDAQMVKDLSQYYIVPSKSYNEFGVPPIPKEYIWDFIRGYFDGDGSIYFTNNKFTLSFVGNKKFLSELRELLGKSNVSLCQNSVSKITYDLKISGYKDVSRILEAMYKDSTPETRLDRKYNLSLIALLAHHS